MHLTAALFLLPVTLAAHLRVSIAPHHILPNPSILPPSTTATLTTLGQIYSAHLRTDNAFDFRNVTVGSYLFDVNCHTHSFAPLRVDVHKPATIEKTGGTELKEVEAWGTFRGNEWSNKGEFAAIKEIKEGRKDIYTFDVKVQAAKEYLIERQGCKSTV